MGTRRSALLALMLVACTVSEYEYDIEGTYKISPYTAKMLKEEFSCRINFPDIVVIVGEETSVVGSPMACESYRLDYATFGVACTLEKRFQDFWAYEDLWITGDLKTRRAILGAQWTIGYDVCSAVARARLEIWP